ncbi:MAG: hypothetical protein U0746_05790 [Gemmataceae bacterium]
MTEHEGTAVAEGRKSRYWIGWAVGVVLALATAFFVGVAYDRYKDDAAWREACAELDRTNPRWRWQQLQADRPAMPDGENAALVATQASRIASSRWPDWGGVLPLDRVRVDAESGGEESSTTDEASMAAGQRRTEEGQHLLDGLYDLPPNARLRPYQADALRAAFAEPVAAAAVAEAMKMERLQAGYLPRSWTSPLISTNFVGDIQSLRATANILDLSARSLCEEGRGDEALARARALIVLSRATGEESMIDALVECAIRAIAVGSTQRTLAQTEPNGEALAATQVSFEDDAKRPRLANAFRWERAIVEDTIRSLDEGRLGPDVRMQMAGPAPVVTGVAQIDEALHRLRGGSLRKRDYVAVLADYSRRIELASAGPDELRRHQAELAAAEAALPAYLVGSAPKVVEADMRSTALVRSARTALAAERFRRAQGRWPTAIDELVPAYLRSVPLDPFDLKPLKLAKKPDGIVIYSIGTDNTDNGGEVLAFPDFTAMTDSGVRLWDVSARHASPPLPKVEFMPEGGTPGGP